MEHISTKVFFEWFSVGEVVGQPQRSSDKLVRYRLGHDVPMAIQGFRFFFPRMRCRCWPLPRSLPQPLSLLQLLLLSLLLPLLALHAAVIAVVVVAVVAVAVIATAVCVAVHSAVGAVGAADAVGAVVSLMPLSPLR